MKKIRQSKLIYSPLDFNGSPEPLAELEELLWIDPRDALLRNDIAPLLREHVFMSLLAYANDMGGRVSSTISK